ncbi:cytochrome P450 [Phanerochaete sordida]|uniref:Cytochrome P450 n=1 Tax=Phanerochaete sordida TaxID=48140 RepID=A0A9P3GQ51_9APHY|nr:cytochrome P450 [Phanerochaete sordida]
MDLSNLPKLNTLDIFLCGAAVIILHQLYSRLTQRRPPYPPGPPGYPLIGHLKSPENPISDVYRDWGREYNTDVVHLTIVGTHIVVLNSLQACTDLLEKRSPIYSDRPLVGMTMLADLCGLGWSFGFQHFGQTWRDGRKAFQSQFNSTSVRRFRPTVAYELHRFLARLVESPHTWEHHLEMMSGGLIMNVAYGIDVRDENDPYLLASERTAECGRVTLVPGNYLVDSLPFLKYVPEWFPGANFKREAREWRRSIMYALHAPYEVVKTRMEKNPETAPDCVARFLMEEVVNPAKDHAYWEQIAKSVTGSMYIAGSETTSSGITSFMLAMTLYPEVQRRAQASIDAVCAGRLPDFGDEAALPYVHALVRECLRWNPIVPMNLAHRCMEDDIYKEYLIPKGSVVVANIRAIMHDTDVFPDPTRFKPERFLKQSADGTLELNNDILDPTRIAFGFGRRECPGRFMAYQAFWLAVANILASFNVECKKDDLGRPIVPSGEYYLGFTNRPKPFPCEIRLRSREHKALVLQAAGVV